MSSRSNGVTNVRFRRSTSSRVSLSPSCSDSLIARRASPFAGNSSSSWRSRREISTAFADACANRLKNSRFCGTSEILAIARESLPNGARVLRPPLVAQSGLCLARLRVGGVRELAELRRQQVRRLLADVDRVLADPFERARDDDHPEAVLSHRRVLPELED